MDARKYHERTNHTPGRLRTDSFQLDFANQPRPFKQYKSQPETALPAPELPKCEVFDTISASPVSPDIATGVSIADVATICWGSNGRVKTARSNGREIPYGAASCTGKLYHIELYLITGGSDEYTAGVYQYDPVDHQLVQLRTGDYRGFVSTATGSYESVLTAPMILLVTSHWWRNAWKYRNRTYRHAFWDSGTISAHILSLAHAYMIRAEICASHVDEQLAMLLGLSPESEAPLFAIPLGAKSKHPPAPALDPIEPAIEPYSPTVKTYPDIYDAWKQSRLDSGKTATSWRETCQERGSLGIVAGNAADIVDLSTYSPTLDNTRSLSETIKHRASRRSYAHTEMNPEDLATLLEYGSRGVPADWRSEQHGRLQYNDVYCLLNGVSAIPDGAYQYHPLESHLERIGPSDRSTKAHLALDQPWAGEAHANIYYMANIDSIVRTLGNRGYRLAQLEAGISLGRVYLATYAHPGLGGTGLKFYDSLVTEPFSPRATDQTPMCLFAAGPTVAD